MKPFFFAALAVLLAFAANAGGLGLEKPRSWFWSFPDEKKAKGILPEFSGDCIEIGLDGSGSLEFKVPGSWEGREMFLLAETSDGSLLPPFILVVGGMTRGSFEGDGSAAEFDLTGAFNPGEKAQVRFEGVSGTGDKIEVRAFSRPKEMIRDFTVSAEKVADGSGGNAWEMTIHADCDVETIVCDMDGNTVAGPFAVKKFPVANVEEWRPGDPKCYKVVLNNGEEFVSKIFAFREKKSRWRIKPGIPPYAVGRKEMEKAADALLEANCNAVTADDSPRSGYWRHVCELKGILVLEGDSAKGAEPLPVSPATKYAYRDWTARATNFFQRVVVKNLGLAASGAGTRLFWTALSDGVECASGEIDLRNLQPGREAAYDMPEAAWKARWKGSTVSVRFDFRTNARTVANDQIDVVESRDLSPLSAWSKGMLGFFGDGEIRYDEINRDMEFRAGGGRIVFSKATGQLSQFSSNGAIGWSDVVASPVEARLGGHSGKIVSCETTSVSSTDGGLFFSSLTDWEFPARKDGDKPIRARQITRWTVLRNGTVTCDTEFSEQVTLAVPLNCDKAEWFGYGPWANRSGEGGAFLGKWKLPIAALADGSRGGVRAVKAGKLSIRTLAAPFSLAGREGELELAPDGRRFTLAISLGNAPLAAGVADNRDMLLPERWRRAIDKSKRRKK